MRVCLIVLLGVDTTTHYNLKLINKYSNRAVNYSNRTPNKALCKGKPSGISSA